MKTKFLSLLFLSLQTVCLQAQEDLLQIVPKTIVADGTRQTLELEMKNTSNKLLAFQFTIHLPEGIRLIAGNKPFGGLPAARYPFDMVYNEDFGIEIPTFRHEAIMPVRNDEEGYATFAVSPNDITSYIKGNSGTILKIYVEADAGLAPGCYPILLDNVAFTDHVSDNSLVSVRPPVVSTYVTVGNAAPEGRLDLSGLTGYLPNDVAAETSRTIAGQSGITEVFLTNLDDGTSPIDLGSTNALLHVKPESEFAAKQLAAGHANIVSGGICKSLVLTDRMPFGTSTAFTAEKASYRRTLPAAGWYSLCLPYSCPTPESITVERFKEFNAAAGTITFESGAIESGKPCIFRSDATDVEFAATNVAISPTTATPTDGAFTGSYLGMAAGTITGCYGLFADGTGFGRTSATAYVDPFRAIATVASEAKTIKAVHGGTSAISLPSTAALSVAGGKGCLTIANGGKTRKVAVTSASGMLMQEMELGTGESRTIRLCPGVYVVDNKKTVVR